MSASGAARVELGRPGESRIDTGLAVLDHLLGELASAGGFSLVLRLAPAEPEAEVGQAGAAVGRAFREALPTAVSTGLGTGVAPSDEALAMVVVEASGRPLVASNADLSSTRAGGLRADLAATFLEGLADAAGLTVHVRLIEGESSEHVLSAIFKALGIALARACTPV